MKTTKRFEYLFAQCIKNICTQAERDEFMKCIASQQYDELLHKLIEETLPEYKEMDILNEKRAEEIFKTIRCNIESPPPSAPVYRRQLFRGMTAAAAVLFLFVSFCYFLKNRDQHTIQIVKAAKKDKSILPGGNKAVLILGDGTKVTLDNAGDGNVARQGNTNILKIGNQIAYKTNGNSKEVLYNLISTPRGGQYQIELADGSKVWLNASSSLRFPTAFTGKERKVELSGEAYFEIAKNAAMPFKVNVAGKNEIEVLGTHFNINSYLDEAVIKTTLIEGKIKVTRLATGDVKHLLPGNQSQLYSNGNFLVVEKANIYRVMAWKNGFFNFDNEDLQGIMRQLCRWYDVDVEYHGNAPQLTFSGGIERDLTLQQVLKVLEKSDVHFKIDNRKIIVTQ